MILLEGDDSTGDPIIVWMGSRDPYHKIVARGTFDGATVTLQSSLDQGTTWHDVEDYVFTEKGVRTILLPEVALVRGEIASAGSGTSITMEIQ